MLSHINLRWGSRLFLASAGAWLLDGATRVVFSDTLAWSVTRALASVLTLIAAPTLLEFSSTGVRKGLLFAGIVAGVLGMGVTGVFGLLAAITVAARPQDAYVPLLESLLLNPASVPLSGIAQMLSRVAFPGLIATAFQRSERVPGRSVFLGWATAAVWVVLISNWLTYVLVDDAAPPSFMSAIGALVFGIWLADMGLSLRRAERGSV